MSFSNSPLVDFTLLSPNHSGTRTHRIDRITVHCTAGQMTVEELGELFARPARQASSNYGVGLDGRIGLYVEEQNRSWCSSSNENDQRAITIEVSSDDKEPYAVGDVPFESAIRLIVDVCERNGITGLLWFADKDRSLSYEPGPGEAIMTVHRWFADKSCPGEYLYSRHGEMASRVTQRLRGAR